jgi:hypothetical protein
MKTLTAILFLSALLMAGACVFTSENEKPNAADANAANDRNSVTEKTDSNAPAGGSAPAAKKDEAAKSAARTDCLNVKVAGKKIDEKQTFPFDHEPFRGACFVTAHDPAFDDPALNSEFYIFQGGKEVFRFPNQFNGVTTGCWAEAVAFQDLNDDGRTEVIVAGMCSAKSAPYSENMVYVNRGTEFTTSEEANYTLEKFKRIKDITDFVKRNQEQFFQ